MANGIQDGIERLPIRPGKTETLLPQPCGDCPGSLVGEEAAKNRNQMKAHRKMRLFFSSALPFHPYFPPTPFKLEDERP